MTSKYTIGIATTKNENTLLENMVSTLEKDILNCPLSGEVETIICLNNYNNKTKQISGDLEKKHPILNIRTIKSEHGLIPAQRKIILESNSVSDFIIFYDSDIAIGIRSTQNLIGFMEKNPEVHVVSGDQKAYPLSSFWYGVFNIIGLNPQIMTPRKYLIGKDFAVRKRSYLVPNFIPYEDTFLSYYIVHKFGRGGIRTVPDVCVGYMGPRTFRDYFSKRKRLALTKDQMFEAFPEFKELSSYFKKERIPEEIFRLTDKEKFQLFLHDILKKTCMKVARLQGGQIWRTLNTTKDNQIFDGA